MEADQISSCGAFLEVFLIIHDDFLNILRKLSRESICPAHRCFAFPFLLCVALIFHFSHHKLSQSELHLLFTLPGWFDES